MYIYNPETEEYEIRQECAICHRDIPTTGYDVCDECQTYLDVTTEE